MMHRLVIVDVERPPNTFLSVRVDGFNWRHFRVAELMPVLQRLFGQEVDQAGHIAMPISDDQLQSLEAAIKDLRPVVK
jgi:hypothetical protein